jgi:hypothetical protein
VIEAESQAVLNTQNELKMAEALGSAQASGRVGPEIVLEQIATLVPEIIDG